MDAEFKKAYLEGKRDGLGEAMDLMASNLPKEGVRSLEVLQAFRDAIQTRRNEAIAELDRLR